MSVLKDYTDEVQRQLADGSAIVSPDDYPKLVSQAVLLYSNKIPLEVVKDLTSDGTGEFALADLTGFDQELSGDVEIEYPISTGLNPNFLDRRSWTFYRKPTGKVIRIVDVPTAGRDVRFTYKAKHSISESASTVVDSHFDVLCKLATAEGCDQLARYYTQTGEGNEATIGGTSLFISKAKEYETRAMNLRKKAYEVLGAGAGTDTGTAAASVTTNWDQGDSRGFDRQTHKRRYR